MSQVDTFDPKPELTKRGGQMLPFDNLQTERKTGVALPSPFTFQQYGESGIPVSDLFPHLSKCVDDMAVIRSMYAELPNHEMSLMLMNTGDQRLVRPSFGSWLTWGMGSENQNLPGFVALCPGRSAGRRSRQLAIRISAGRVSGNAGRYVEYGPVEADRRHSQRTTHGRSAASTVRPAAKAELAASANSVPEKLPSKHAFSRLNWRIACRPKRRMRLM